MMLLNERVTGTRRRRQTNSPPAVRRLLQGCALVVATSHCLALSGKSAHADEGGVSFWLPGQYGSLAALPPDQGFSMPLVSYGYRASLSGSETLSSGTQLRFDLETDYFGQFIVPTYAPDAEILDAQPAFSLAFIPAHNSVSGTVTDGGVTASASDSVTGLSDIYPTFQLFWPGERHNFMA